MNYLEFDEWQQKQPTMQLESYGDTITLYKYKGLIYVSARHTARNPLYWAWQVYHTNGGKPHLISRIVGEHRGVERVYGYEPNIAFVIEQAVIAQGLAPMLEERPGERAQATNRDNFLTAYLDRVNLYGASFALYYDGQNKKLHILDWDEPGTKSVTNAAGVEFFQELDAFLFKHMNEQTHFEFDIYLYGTDGLISEFEPAAHHFHHAALGDPHLYSPFVDECRGRVKAIY